VQHITNMHGSKKAHLVYHDGDRSPLAMFFCGIAGSRVGKSHDHATVNVARCVGVSNFRLVAER
jgi:hypothetical protein